MTDPLTADVPAHIALRRRYGAWNGGREAPPGPIFFEPERGRWVIAGHAEALAVFKQSGGETEQEQKACPFAEAGDDVLSGARSLLRKNLFFRVSPDLERLRRIVMQQIGGPALGRIEPAIEACARDVLEGALASRAEAFDVVGDLARPFVDRSVSDLVGVPEKDRRVVGMLADTSRDVFELAMTDAEVRMAYLAFSGLCRRVEGFLFGADEPQTPLAKGILEAVRTNAWSREEAISQVALLLIAARTSVITAIASLIHHLATHPEAWAALREGSLAADAVIEESLRLGPPAAIAPKTINSDTVLGDVKLRAGERVLLLVGRANRDPAVFTNPDVFDPWRPRKINFAFGVGRHRCPGQALATLQLSSMLGAFLARFPAVELAETPTWGESLHGERPITRLMIRTPPAKATP